MILKILHAVQYKALFQAYKSTVGYETVHQHQGALVQEKQADINRQISNRIDSKTKYLSAKD